MIKNKFKDFTTHHNSKDLDLNNNLRNNRTIHYNDRIIPHMMKKNLPELKITKLKSKLPAETENDKQEEQKEQKLKGNKSHSQCKKKDIVLPQIKGKRVKNEVNPLKHNLNTLNINKPKPTLPIKARQKPKVKNDQICLNTLKEKEPSIDHLDYMTEKLNMINSLFNSLSSIAGGTECSYPVLNYMRPKATSVTPDILNQTFRNFEPSIASYPSQFSHEDFIKAFSYNSHQGNVRDYNEDTVQASKVGSFHFFGIYDGHGGNGCSKFLKENLHLYIKEFSIEGIKQAINDAEDIFIRTRALTKEGNIVDPSGSCGIMAVIQKNQCIIANVGDSRCVVFKNNNVDFCTEDHKPGIDFEKERIIKAGGKVYQNSPLFPLYQNGQEIAIPWRVLPGRLSVSRTFGDVEAKLEKFGGMKDVVVALPDFTKITLTSEYNFIILGCDGIFDVLSNEELLECINIVLKLKSSYSISDICAEASNMIIKSALAKDSFDNVSCIVIALNIK